MAATVAEQTPSRTERKRAVQGWLFASPYLLYALIFFLIPAGWSLILTVQRWNLISPERDFIGVGNFVEAFSSGQLWQAVWVTYRFMLLIVPAVTFISIVLAVIVNSLPWGQPVFAVGFFMPYLSSGVAIAVVVRGILGFTSPVNIAWRNLFGTSPNWLGDPALANLVIAGMIIWKFAGYYALVFLAVLQGIPREIYEAASLDGASGWRTFWSITFPLLYPGIYTVLILAIGTAFGIFTEPYTLTGGGPAGQTLTWPLLTFHEAFERFRAGYGATLALLNAVFTFVSILLIRRVVEAWGRRYGFGLKD